MKSNLLNDALLFNDYNGKCSINNKETALKGLLLSYMYIYNIVYEINVIYAENNLLMLFRANHYQPHLLEKLLYNNEFYIVIY